MSADMGHLFVFYIIEKKNKTRIVFFSTLKYELNERNKNDCF